MPSSSLLIHPPLASPTPHRFLLLPHPRTHVPSYYLLTPTHLLETQTLTSTSSTHSLFLTPLDQIVPANLSVLSPIDPVFLLISYCTTAIAGIKEAKMPFRTYEDVCDTIQRRFEQARKEEAKSKGVEVKGEWGDLSKVFAWQGVKVAMGRICDVQETENTTTYRLSPSKIFSLLDDKLFRLASPDTFARAPNTLLRTFDRRFHSNPQTNGNDEQQAQQLRNQIAAETIAVYLTHDCTTAWFEKSQYISNPAIPQS